MCTYRHGSIWSRLVGQARTFRAFNRMFPLIDPSLPLSSIPAVCSSAKDQLTNTSVAVKKIMKPFSTPVLSKRTYRELKLLKHIRHENIISLSDIFISPLEDIYFVTEWVSPLLLSVSVVRLCHVKGSAELNSARYHRLLGTDLHRLLTSRPLDDQFIQYFLYQMLVRSALPTNPNLLCPLSIHPSRSYPSPFLHPILIQRGLKFVHSAGVIHRDLKPSNILVNENCDLKICDFGLARIQDSQMTGYVSTRYYRAPEIMLTWQQYDHAVDIWSVGCILAEMLIGKPLFPGKDRES
jgi:p38 MAP kinase